MACHVFVCRKLFFINNSNRRFVELGHKGHDHGVWIPSGCSKLTGPILLTTFICIFSNFPLEGKSHLKSLLPGCKFCFIDQFCGRRLPVLCVSLVFLNGAEQRMLGNIIWLLGSLWESERGRKLLFYCEVCQMISEKLWYHSEAMPSWIETARLGRHLERAYNSSGLVWAFIRNSSIGSIYITVVECENKHSCGIALNISVQQGIKRELYRWTTDKHNSSSSGQFNWGTK